MSPMGSWNITVALMEPSSRSEPANMFERRNASELQANQEQNNHPPQPFLPLHCYQLGCRHGLRLQRGHSKAETASLPLPSLFFQLEVEHSQRCKFGAINCRLFQNKKKTCWFLYLILKKTYWGSYWKSFHMCVLVAAIILHTLL